MGVTIQLPNQSGPKSRMQEARIASFFDIIEHDLATLLDRKFKFANAISESKLPSKALEKLGVDVQYAMLFDALDRMVCASVLDVRLGIWCAGTLMRVPSSGMEDRLEEKRLGTGLWTETVQEVQNILLGSLGRALLVSMDDREATFSKEKFNSVVDIPRTGLLVVEAQGSIDGQLAGLYQMWLPWEVLSRFR